VAGEHSDEHLGPIKGGNFLTNEVTIGFSKKASVP
jgi:hypothetical protein